MDNTENLARAIKYVLKRYGNEYVFSHFDSIETIDKFSDALAEHLDKMGIVVKTKDM